MGEKEVSARHLVSGLSIEQTGRSFYGYFWKFVSEPSIEQTLTLVLRKFL